MSAPSPSSLARTFRLPRSTYLVVLFVLIGAVPLAFSGAVHALGGESGDVSASTTTDVVLGPRLLFLLLPLVAAAFIARTGTHVDADGVIVHALLGTRRLPWDRVRGLSVSGRSVYLVLVDGSVRLPCVRVADLAAVARASAGRLPAIADPVAKHPLASRPRRAVRRRP